MCLCVVCVCIPKATLKIYSGPAIAMIFLGALKNTSVCACLCVCVYGVRVLLSACNHVCVCMYTEVNISMSVCIQGRQPHFAILQMFLQVKTPKNKTISGVLFNTRLPHVYIYIYMYM